MTQSAGHKQATSRPQAGVILYQLLDVVGGYDHCSREKSVQSTLREMLRISAPRSGCGVDRLISSLAKMVSSPAHGDFYEHPNTNTNTNTNPHPHPRYGCSRSIRACSFQRSVRGIQPCGQQRSSPAGNRPAGQSPILLPTRGGRPSARTKLDTMCSAGRVLQTGRVRSPMACDPASRFA